VIVSCHVVQWAGNHAVLRIQASKELGQVEAEQWDAKLKQQTRKK
jgi:hypothetical protein